MPWTWVPPLCWWYTSLHCLQPPDSQCHPWSHSLGCAVCLRVARMDGDKQTETKWRKDWGSSTVWQHAANRLICMSHPSRQAMQLSPYVNLLATWESCLTGLSTWNPMLSLFVAQPTFSCALSAPSGTCSHRQSQNNWLMPSLLRNWTFATAFCLDSLTCR